MNMKWLNILQNVQVFKKLLATIELALIFNIVLNTERAYVAEIFLYGRQGPLRWHT